MKSSPLFTVQHVA